MKHLTSLRSLLFVFSLIAVAGGSAQSHWAERTYYETPVTLRDSSVTLIPGHEHSPQSLCVEARGAMKSGIGERSGLAPSFWGMKVTLGSDTLLVTLRHGNTDFGDLLDKRFTRISVCRNEDEVEATDFTDDFATSSGGYNTLLLEIDGGSSMLKLSGGSHSCVRLMEIPFEGVNLSKTEASVWAKGELALSSFSTEISMAPESVLATSWTRESLADYLSRSTDPVEGYWEYLDRKNDPQYARLGGRYVMAVVKSAVDAEHYDLVYLSGAETLASRWSPFMLKGHLIPTVFQSHYDLHWYDSTFEPITTGVHASITDNAILTLSFPLLKTVLRFSKASDDKKRQTYQEQGEID